ncbi:hypothetical protein ABZ752_26505 [Streptomyces roseifaciens]
MGQLRLRQGQLELGPFEGHRWRLNGDGKADVGVLYNNGQEPDGTNRTGLWTTAGAKGALDRFTKAWTSEDSWNWYRSDLA